MEESGKSIGENERREPFLKKNKVMANEVIIPEIVKLIDEGHSVTLNLKGFSMRPFLEDGRDKALLVKPVRVEVGTPVLAELPDRRYVLHRVVSIKGDEVTLLGDGNLSTESCRLCDVKAEAIGFYRKGHSKIDKTNGPKWLVYSFFWTRLLPLRRYLLACYRLCRKLGLN